MSATTVLTKHSGSLMSTPIDFRMLGRSLQYLSLTRPDLFAVNILSRYMQSTTAEHCDVDWARDKDGYVSIKVISFTFRQDVDLLELTKVVFNRPRLSTRLLQTQSLDFVDGNLAFRN
ncbi:LOW QUALITY PROTEIN: hypothetical protein V2J09_018228 [Rumex salicifolius]